MGCCILFEKKRISECIEGQYDSTCKHGSRSYERAYKLMRIATNAMSTCAATSLKFILKKN